jgi:hypothetical protein
MWCKTIVSIFDKQYFLMSRSLIIGLIITIAIISGLAAFFYINYIKVKNKPAIEAVPDNAALVFEIADIQKNLALFYGTDMWKDLQLNEGLKKIDRTVLLVDSLITTNPDLQSVLADNKTTISFHSNGYSLNALFIAETGSYTGGDELIRWIARVSGGRAVKRIFDKETLYDIVNVQQQPMFTVAFRERLLMLSADGTLVEESVRKLKYHFINPSKGFGQARSIANVGAEVNMFVNYQQLPALLGYFNKDEYKDLHGYLRQFANWSVMDIRISTDHFGISGVTFTDDSLFQFLDLFKTQSPVQQDLSNTLPLSTSYYLQLGFSDYPQFSSDLNEYLQHTGRLDAYMRYGDSLEERYHLSLVEKLTPQIGNTALIGLHESGSSDFSRELFAVLQFKDNKQVDDLFLNCIKEIEKKEEGDSASVLYNGKEIRRLRLGNVFKLFYGHVFEHLESPYYVLHNNTFIFANDADVLRSVLSELDANTTLASSESYRKHHKASAASSNISLFLSPGRSLQVPSFFGNEDLVSALSRFRYDFHKFEFVEVQYANSSNNTFYTNVNIRFNPAFREETRMLWMAKMDTTFDMQPAIVYNSELKKQCILVQDVLNTVYYISDNGSILWRSKLSGKINSEVYAVDANRNGEISYLFSTDRQVCLINNKGNNLYGYPVRFPGTATAGISLFDFYGDSSFQYFVPLENNRIMGYQLNGKPVQGWNPKATESRITSGLGGFTSSSGAYIAGTSENGRLMIYGIRPQQPKLTQYPAVSAGHRAYVFTKDSAATDIWAVDTGGRIVQYTVDASLSVQVKTQIDPGSALLRAQVTQASSGYFILASYTEGFTLFSGDGKKVFSRTYTDTLVSQPFFTYTYQHNPMIGYAEKVSGRIFWYDTKGKLYNAFPLEGITPFSSGDLLQNNANYTVIGDTKNNIKTYRLK